jgi:hypothetical protein
MSLVTMTVLTSVPFGGRRIECANYFKNAGYAST